MQILLGSCLRVHTLEQEINLINVYDMKLVFDFDLKYGDELHKIDKKLIRYIRGVENYFVKINRRECTVTITIFQNRLWKRFDLDFEFSKN